MTKELNKDFLLLERIRDDDRKSFEQIYNLYFKQLYFYAYKILRDEVIVEEIVQEVYVYLWEKRKQLNINSSLKSYLYTAVRNRCINYIKYELPKRRVADEAELNSLTLDAVHENNYSSDELRRHINSAVGELPPKCRTIFLLSREEGLTYQEIAEELELSVKTVENQIIIALKKLRVSLKDVWSLM